MVLIQFQWHLASALGRAPICVHANQWPLPPHPGPGPPFGGLLGQHMHARNQRSSSCLPPPQVSTSLATAVRTPEPTGRPRPGAGLGQGREKHCCSIKGKPRPRDRLMEGGRRERGREQALREEAP